MSTATLLARPEPAARHSPPKLRDVLRWMYLPLLSAAVFFIHGYHPFTEDGGLYAVGAEYILNPRLFPLGTDFVTDHARWSAFPWLMAGLSSLCHLQLPVVLFLTYLATTALMLYAGRDLLHRLNVTGPAMASGVALLAAWWTLPVAGTSLMLMDPYATARSFSTPLALLALGCALDDWSSFTRPAPWLCAGYLVLCAAFHPMMTVYALGQVLVVRLLRHRLRWKLLAGFAALVLVGGWMLEATAPGESAAVVAASLTRYYWFLSQWHWYEWAGLPGPLVILWLAARRLTGSTRAVELVRALTAFAALAVVSSLIFCHPATRSHLVDRLQPLRTFVTVYAVLPLMLGAALARLLPRFVLAAFLCASCVGMFCGQRSVYASSPHLETPWTSAENGWAAAFLWARDNTPVDALFALDANYIESHGEDAHLFRAIALRNAVSDRSKDGGEAAAMRPELAPRWLSDVALTTHLNQLDDRARDHRLLARGVTWVVLAASAPTNHPCPYANAAAKVCRLR